MQQSVSHSQSQPQSQSQLQSAERQRRNLVMEFFSWFEAKNEKRENELLKTSTSKYFPDFKPLLLSKSPQGHLYGPLPLDVLDKEWDSTVIKEQVLQTGNNLILVLDNVFSVKEVEKILDLSSRCGKI